MAFRKKMRKGASKRLFKRTAGSRKVHPKNRRASPMRGGIRL